MWCFRKGYVNNDFIVKHFDFVAIACHLLCENVFFNGNEVENPDLIQKVFCLYLLNIMSHISELTQ